MNVSHFQLKAIYRVEDEKGSFELLDGQPRTILNLTAHEREQFLYYKLMIYVCEGNDKEKLDWFRTINIAGAVLTPQELRNAIYTGSWLSDAKRYFSKNKCAAYGLANKYLNGEINRQVYLEQAIKWISSREGIGFEDYMSAYQQDSNALDLWLYFNNVIIWLKNLPRILQSIDKLSKVCYNML